MRIQVKIHCMAAAELADLIPQETVNEIKRTDPTPLFRAYVVGHEGEARGRVIGIGNIVKRWAQTVIEKLHEKIQEGLELFHGHGATNDKEGRIPIGRVVGKALKTINGRLSSVIACYIEPAYKRHNLDVASIEATVEMDVDREGKIDVVGVGDVTGVALGSSQIETPGFPGATLLCQLQAFAETGGNDPERYFDPERNPMIRLSPDDPPKSGDVVPDNIDPGKNPLIKVE